MARNRTLLWIVLAVLALHGAVLVWELQWLSARRAANEASAPVIQVVVRGVSLAHPSAGVPSRLAAQPAVRAARQPVKTDVTSPSVNPHAAAVAQPRLRRLPDPPLSSPGRLAPIAPSTPEPVSQSASESVAESGSRLLRLSAQTVSAQSAPVAAVSAEPASAGQTGGVSAAGSASAGTPTGAAGSSVQGQRDVVEPPSADAVYLDNPPPDYPLVSRLRNESGTVVVRVLIGVDGRAQAAQIEKSSGYGRLDDAALTTARDRWRYRPGTRNGVPKAMWYDVPIPFQFGPQ